MAASAELTAEMDARATWVNIQAQGYVSAAMTLDGFYSYWVISMLDYPYQLSTNTPLEAARIWGLNFLNAHPGVDGSQFNQLYPAYGAFLQAAMNGQALPPLPPPPYATGTPPTIPGVVNSAVAPIPPPPAPIDISVPNPALAALMTTAAPAPTTPAPGTPPTPTPTTPTPQAQHVSVPVPRDIFSSLLGTGGGAASGAEAGTWAAPVTFGISIAVGAILGALFGSLFGGSDTKALQQAVNQLRQALAQTADELERFSWSIAYGLGKLFQAVAYIWDNFLDAIWTYLKQLWNLLWTLVSSVIPKLIQVMRDLRKFLDTIYQKYILPAMRYVLLIRQVLILLRALHIPIAARLDKILSQIQAALYVPFLALATIANGYGAWINTILTNRYTLQRGVFLRTMYAYQLDWINLWWTAQTPAVAASGALPGGGAGVPTNDAEILAEVKAFATTGAGPMAADAANAQAMMDAVMAGQV